MPGSERPSFLQAYEDGFRLVPDETLAGALATYEQAAETEIIAGIDDLGQPVPRSGVAARG